MFWSDKSKTNQLVPATEPREESRVSAHNADPGQLSKDWKKGKSNPRGDVYIVYTPKLRPEPKQGFSDIAQTESSPGM